MDAMVQQRIEMMEAAFVDHADGNLFLQLGETYRAAGDLDGAMRVLRQGLESHPAFTAAFALLGSVLQEAGRLSEAAVCFEQLLELDPADADARVSLDTIRAALRPAASNGRGAGAANPAPNGNGASSTSPAGGAARAAAARSASAAASASYAAEALPWEDGPSLTSAAGVSPDAARAGAQSDAGERQQPPGPSRPHGDPLRPAVPDGDDDDDFDGERGSRHGEAPTKKESDDERASDDVARNGVRPVSGFEAQLSARGVDSTAVALADLLVGLLEYRDPFFRGGTSMTRLLAAAVAREMQLDDEAVDAIALGAVLRDLGQIPLKGLIDKPGSELGADGRRKLERHVDTAIELLEGVRLPQQARDTIRHHHERWDGAGYPDGLAGEAIPLGARIVAVADSFAAMIAARPHRLPKRVPAALEDIRGGSGKQYDPAVVDALVRVLSSTSWRGLRFGLRHHVLVVDPDETRAMVTATKLCSNGYLAEAAFNAETARERLHRTRIVGLIVSAELTEGSNGSLMREVREAERHGMIPVIVTDAGVSERIVLLEAGADVCLARGSSFEELKATLEAFLRREGKPIPATGAGRADAPWAGLQGDIEDFPLGWLLQVLNYDSRTAAVFLTGDGDEGAIYLERGNPRHAQTKSLLGEEAFRAMLRWPTGSFSVDPDATTEEQSVKASLMNLLLEQAVQDDHAAFFGAVKV